MASITRHIHNHQHCDRLDLDDLPRLEAIAMAKAQISKSNRSIERLPPPDMDGRLVDHMPWCPPHRSVASGCSETAGHSGHPISTKLVLALPDVRNRYNN
jgi:hypothetical protein